VFVDCVGERERSRVTFTVAEVPEDVGMEMVATATATA
jgi:hypothetical protein